MYSVYAMKIFEKMNICSNVYFFLITFYESTMRFLKWILLVMLKMWKTSADKGKLFCASLIDLTKAFDCLNHEFTYCKAKYIWF